MNKIRLVSCLVRRVSLKQSKYIYKKYEFVSVLQNENIHVLNKRTLIFQRALRICLLFNTATQITLYSLRDTKAKNL